MCRNRTAHRVGIAAAPMLDIMGASGWAFVKNTSDQAIKQDSAITGARYDFGPGDVRLVDAQDLTRVLSFKINGADALIEVERGAL